MKLDEEGISRDDPKRVEDREIVYPERMSTLVPHYTPDQWEVVRSYVESPTYSGGINYPPRKTGHTNYLHRPEGPLDKVPPMDKMTRDRLWADRINTPARTENELHVSPLNELLAQIINDSVSFHTIVRDVYSHLETPTSLPITTEERDTELFSDSEDERSHDTTTHVEHCTQWASLPIVGRKRY